MNLSTHERTALRGMLAGPEGILLRAYLAAIAPAITGQTIESRALSGAERQGWDNATAALNGLAAPEPPETEQPLPDFSTDN